jgi:hypothetical protein
MFECGGIMENYKELYYENLIDKQKSDRFIGWLFLIILPLFTILVWIFGVEDLWSLKDKIWLTIITTTMTFIMGWWKVILANKEIKRLEIENGK